MQRQAASAELRAFAALNSVPVGDSFQQTLCSAGPADSGSQPAEAITWQVHLLREEPGKLVGIVAAALFVFASAFVLFHHFIPGLVTSLLLLVSVAEYLLPLKFTLDPRGAHVSCGPVEWLSMDWANVRSVYRTSYGIKLSPFVDPKGARMEQCRGVRLRVPPALLAEVESVISRRQKDDHP